MIRWGHYRLCNLFPNMNFIWFDSHTNTSIHTQKQKPNSVWSASDSIASYSIKTTNDTFVWHSIMSQPHWTGREAGVAASPSRRGVKKTSVGLEFHVPCTPPGWLWRSIYFFTNAELAAAAAAAAGSIVVNRTVFAASKHNLRSVTPVRMSVYVCERERATQKV